MKWMLLYVMLNWNNPKVGEYKTEELYLKADQVISIIRSETKEIVKNGRVEEYWKSCLIEVYKDLDIKKYRVQGSCYDLKEDLNRHQK